MGIVTQHWTNHILHENINDPEFVLDLYQHILSTVPLTYARPIEEGPLDFMFEDDHPSMREKFEVVRRFMYQCIDEYIDQVYETSFDYHVTGFVAMNSQYTRQPLHVHRSSFLTGVFYINVDEQSGNLMLHDPRSNAVRAAPDEIMDQFAPVAILPKPGDMVVFPSYLYHDTEVNMSPQPRILVPFDAWAKTSNK